MIRLPALALVMLSAAIPHALSDVREVVRAACREDVRAHCGKAFSRSQVIACLATNAASVSDGCRSALSAAACNAGAPKEIKMAFPCAQ